MHKSLYERYIKRIMDVTLSLLALVVFSPLFLVIGILVRMKLGSPVIFRQPRVGKDGKIFTICKFRTMTNAVDENGNLLPSSQRLTKFGKMLRATSLDELPELINILKGEMSIVGPRPLLVSYLELYNDYQKRRHEVRPGLTGLAQINGRNSLSWEEKFDLDVAYVDGVSFVGDLRIILMTVIKVLRREGITAAQTEVMERFRGSLVKHHE